MKNAVLVLLLMLLPWQSVFAAQRQLSHVLSSDRGTAFVLHHMAEHASQVLHHHDDDDGDDGTNHVDKSQKSVQHLADFEHGGSLAILLPAFITPGMPATDSVVPFWPPDAFSNRTTSPLRRPPRTFA